MSAELKGQDLAAADAAALLEKVIVGGDLSRLSSAERMAYYERVCTSVGLNPFTQPFAYLNLRGRGLVLYAQKGATDQLRSLHGISVDKVEVTYADDLVIVTVVARSRDGRSDSDVGCVPLGRLQGEDRANAIMKAVTKAKRRTTLSICGLGMLDESEVESIPGAVTEPAIVQPVPAIKRVTGGRPSNALDRVADEMATAAEAEAGDALPLPGQGPPPRTATVEGIRRNELVAGIQALVGAGVKLDTGQRWKELARAHEMVEPTRSADMTVGWLEELYRRMRERPSQAQPQTQTQPGSQIAQDKREQDKREQALAGWIAAAPDEATLTELRSDVMGALKFGSLTEGAAEALLEAVAARSAELDLYPEATAADAASDRADAESEDAAASARAAAGLARAGDAVRAVSRRGQSGAEEVILEATVSG